MTQARRVLYLLTCVLPVALWPGSTSYESAKFLAWALAAAAWSALLAVAIFRRLGLSRPPRSILLAGAAQVLVMLPGLWHAHAPVLAARAVLWSTLWWLTVYVTMSTVRTGRDLARLLWCACGSAALVSVYAMLQKFHLLPGPGEWDVPAGISTLGNENYVAEFAAIWLLPSALLFILERGRRRRIAAALIPVALVGILVFSPAMAARVSALAALSLVAAGEAIRRSRWHRLAPIVLGVVAIAGMVAVGMLMTDILAPGHDTGAGDSLPSRVFSANHGDIRRTDWLVARRQWESAPLAGIGAGNYGIEWMGVRASLAQAGSATGLADGAPVATRAHNEYLQAAAELGWIGLACLLALTTIGARTWARSWVAHTDRDSRHALLLVAAGLVTIALQGLVSFPVHMPAPGLAMAVLVGLLYSPALAQATNARPGPPPARWLAVAPLAVALVLLVGAVRAFQGDLLVANGTREFTAGAPAAAVAPLRAGIARLPWPGTGRLYLGQALAATGQPDEALVVLEESLRDRPSFEAPLAMAELHIDGRRYEEASALIDLVDRCRPGRAMSQQADYLRALIALRRQQWEEARVQFESLTSADVEDYRSWLGLGYLHALLGDRATAADCYRKAVAALEAKIAAPAPATRAARGQVAFWQAHLVTARQALESVTR